MLVSGKGSLRKGPRVRDERIHEHHAVDRWKEWSLKEAERAFLQALRRVTHYVLVP